MLKYKDAVREVVKGLESLGILEFTAKQVEERLPLFGIKIINRSWLAECLHKLGYVFNKEKKAWVTDNQVKSVDILTHLKVQDKLTELETKISKIVTDLAEDTYCNNCKEYSTCKYYNPGKTWLGKLFARRDICKAHKELVAQITELGRMVNR